MTPASLVPGEPTRLSPLVRRVLAANPGMMTGPGTNTYLVGHDEVLVIDPGPDDAGHLDAVVAATGALADEGAVTAEDRDDPAGAWSPAA